MMKKGRIILSAMVVCLIISGTFVYGQQKTNRSIGFNGSLMTGYNRGFGMLGSITASNLDKDIPFRMRFSLGVNFLNPGNAEEARRIFVNNATNGTPEKKGHSIDYKLDFLMPRTIFGIEHSYLGVGPRFSSFVGDFKYVGGNEDFEVRSYQWGMGANLENHIDLVKNVELVISYGLDFYFPSTLTGHDSSYSPDNDNVNPKDDNQDNDIPFRYSDANRAVRQPMFMPHLMIGISFDI
jgi:hypothetical protein